jgi:predicted amino acid-binding ACT domain protein
MAAQRQELLALLGGTTVPVALAEVLVSGAPALWLASNTPPVLAADLALCHPPLGAAEVRARGVPFVEGAAWRLTIVAHDRTGLVADTAGALAARGHSVVGASVATWRSPSLALLAVKVSGPLPEPAALAALGEQLRSQERGAGVGVPFRPSRTAKVWVGRDEGQSIVEVRAPDQLGLLWAICGWFAARGLSIEAAAIGGDGIADDVFVVSGGDVDGPALAASL